MSAAAAVRLDVARARRLTRDLAAALDVAVELLREVYDGRAWEVLGYDSWSSYCRAELPSLAVIVKGLPPVERRAKVAELRAGGMSLRAVSELTGLAPNTVRTDAAKEGVQLAEVRSIDGSRRASSATPATPRPRLTLIARAVLVISEAGDAGVTVHQLAKRLRVSQCSAGPLLCRLAKDGRLVYRRPARRGQVGTYVLGKVER